MVLKARKLQLLCGSLHGAFVASVGVRGGGAILAVASNILLARLLGVVQYGKYMVAFSAAMVLGGVAVGGANQLLTRELAAGAATGAVPFTALGRWGARRVAVGVVIAALIFAVWTRLQSGLWGGLLGFAVIGAGTFALGLSAICALEAGVINGFGASTRSQAVVLVVQKGVLLASLGVWWVFMPTIMGVSLALWLQAGAFGVAAVIAWLWIHRIIRNASWTQIESAVASGDRYVEKKWARASRQFLFISVASLLVARLDVILVSSLAGDRVGGVYAAGARIAQIAMIAAVGINIVLSPRISAAWTRRELGTLKRLLSTALALTAPVAILEVGTAIWCAPMLGVILGNAYAASGAVFIWIVVAYALWTVAAPGYALLAMTGKEGTVAYLSWLVLIVNMSMITVLVPREGAAGGGIAMIIGYAVVVPFVVFSVLKELRAARSVSGA